MTPYEQAADAAMDEDRRERVARAEAQIQDEIAERHMMQMANGEICTECGERFPEPQGRPTICRHCGGSVATSQWYAGDRYFASTGDARVQRRDQQAKRLRYERRAARFFGEPRS